MKNEFLKILAFIFIPLMLSGCSLLGRSKYNDDKLIASQDNGGSNKFSSVSPLENGNHYGKIGELDGFWQILEANVSNDKETVLHINFTAHSGKGKLVLVKANSEIETLAEVMSKQGRENFEGDVVVKCISGTNKIKIVGENYGGNFEICQPNGVVFNNTSKYKNAYGAEVQNSGNMLDKDFPF